jgi:hypothetical protein
LNQSLFRTLPDSSQTPNAQPGLGAAWTTFKTQKAIARGQVIHGLVAEWIRQSQPNAQYFATGIDVVYHGSFNGQPTDIWYEIYPGDSAHKNRVEHVKRAGMSNAPWREITYADGR